MSHLQREKTRLALKGAMLELLSEKDLCNISISEITKKARINRSTFYNHYDSEFALFAEIEKDALDDIDSMIASVNPFIKENMEEALIKILRYLKAHKATTRTLVLKRSDPDFYSRIVSLPHFKEKLVQTPICLAYSKLIEYGCEFVIAGILSIMKLYVEKNFEESEENIIKLILACLRY